MNILVTGGNGFIGLNFIQIALENNNQITCIDNLCYVQDLNFDKSIIDDKNFLFVKEDIRNTNLYDFIKKNQFDSIVNFAAETHVDKSIHSDVGFISTNVSGTHNLISICRSLLEEGALPKEFRFIQISTDEVYGSLNSSDESFTEISNLDPSNPYSATKAAADVLCLSYWKTYGFPVIITRCSNNYGPYQYPEKLIPLTISRINDSQKIPIYGDGSQIRDWIHVSDHCYGVLSVLQNGRIGEIYNFGGNSEVRNIDCVEKIIKEIKPKDNISDYISFVKDRPGHDKRYAINSTKSLNELEWKPKINFDDGLRKTITWYQEHIDWIDKQINSKSYIEWTEKHY